MHCFADPAGCLGGSMWSAHPRLKTAGVEYIRIQSVSDGVSLAENMILPLHILTM